MVLARPTCRILIMTATLGIVSACASGIVRPTEPASSIPYTLDAGGIQLSDRPLRIDFGRTDHSTISAMRKLVGAGPQATRLCGPAREMLWPDGTALIFVAGDFRGWRNAEQSSGSTCGPTR